MGSGIRLVKGEAKMGLNNLSIEEKRTWYSAQIQRLRDRKIEETKKKLVQRGYLDEDDYNEFACP